MQEREKNQNNLVMKAISIVLLSLLLSCQSGESGRSPTSEFFNKNKGTQPLVMKGGDPYIRALMRTITASEANFY